MSIKKRMVAVLAATMLLVAAVPMSASAHSNDSYFNIATASGSTDLYSVAQKKDNTTSSYVNYSGSTASGPYQFIVTIFGRSNNGTTGWTDCTTYYMGTSSKRPTAYVTSGTKGYVRQDVYETYGYYAYARIAGKGCGYIGTRATGVWSPDSVPESDCVDYN